LCLCQKMFVDSSSASMIMHILTVAQLGMSHLAYCDPLICHSDNFDTSEHLLDVVCELHDVYPFDDSFPIVTQRLAEVVKTMHHRKLQGKNKVQIFHT